MDKVKKLRALYIKQHGTEPTSVIIGHGLIEEVLKEGYVRQVGEVRELLGMRVFVDHDKANRVEVGNIGC